MRQRWKWQLAAGARADRVLFGVIDIGFFLANAVKVAEAAGCSIARRRRAWA